METNKKIKKRERDFALDLYNLLDKKNLRDFQSFDTLYNVSTLPENGASIFFESKTAKFRGDFIGFIDSLSSDNKLQLLRKTIFLSAQKKTFSPLFQGFVGSLLLDKKITPLTELIYLSAEKGMFTSLLQLRKLKHTKTSIFYKEK